MEPFDTEEGRKWISKISVTGLHKRLNFEVELKAGINIIYGKNGLGKTTLLHIIANLSEIDIDRFKNLSFSSIIVENNLGQSITINKHGDSVILQIDGQNTSYDIHHGTLSEAEQDQIRQIIGQRATYLPAFRSVLERMRESSYSAYSDERNVANFEELARQESAALRGMDFDDPLSRKRYELARANVTKTIRCRQWFGAFVPAIRYPSITDVMEGLTEEWERAQFKISRLEQKQFETAFVDLFSAIANGRESGDEINQKDILETIKDLVAEEPDDETFGPTSNYTYYQLVSAAESAGDGDKKYNTLLQIYVDILNERKSNREMVLKPLIEFQNSVNNFLSEKSLKLARNTTASPARRRVSPTISPESGQPYRLTDLSSGERQIVTMLYSSSRSAFRSGCLLIDEPELSLHMDWQRIILDNIEMQHRGRQIIACTHSPEVGADHDSIDDSRVIFFTPTISSFDTSDSNDIEDI